MKVLVNNVVTNKNYLAQFSSQEEAETYVQSQVDKGMKCPWGKPDHFEVKDENSHENPRAVFVEEVVENNAVEPLNTITRYKFLIPCEYIIIYEDNSAELVMQEVINNRLKEYPSIQEIIHTIMDKGLDSEEMNALQAMRISVKAKYPKP